MIDKYILEIIIKEAEEKKCKIIFMGDSFQLEPVGEDPKIFSWENSYPHSFKEKNKYELTEVKRYDGSLLQIATQIRTNKKPVFTNPENSDLNIVEKFNNKLASDIKSNNNYVVLTSTNKRRVLYNNKIRSFKFNDPNIDMYVRKDDMLVCVSNNFIYSNGELFTSNHATLLFQSKLTILKDENIKEYDVLFYDIDDEFVLFIPDLIESSLHGTDIFAAIEDGRMFIPTEYTKTLIITYELKGEEISFFNREIIIATSGYAISCHKAQGQAWDNVYIDAYWMMPVWNKAKWFYTAITRAKKNVQSINNKYLLIK